MSRAETDTTASEGVESAPELGSDPAGFLPWYLTLFTGIVATLCAFVLAFAALSPIMVGTGFIGGNALLMAGLGFVGSILIVVAALPEDDWFAGGI